MINPFATSDDYSVYNQPQKPLKKILIIAGIVLVTVGNNNIYRHTRLETNRFE